MIDSFKGYFIEEDPSDGNDDCDQPFKRLKVGRFFSKDVE